MKMKPAVLALTVIALGLAGCGGKEKRLAEHMEKGRTFFEQGQYEKAQVELKNVLQIDPKATGPYFLFGQIEERQKNLQRAFGYYLKAVELEPTNIAARVKLGTFYMFAGDLAKAKEQADAVLVGNAQDNGGRVLRASIRAREGDVPGAIGIIESVLQSDAANVDARALLASLLTAQGDRARARQVLADGVKAAPRDVDLRMVLITLLLADKGYDEAVEQYRSLIELDPKSINHRVGMARLLSEQGHLDQAEAALRAAIDASPEDDQRYVILADFLATKRDVKTAETSLQDAIAKRPQAYAVRFALAGLYRTRGPADKAVGVYEAIITGDKVGPNGLRARGELADLELSQGKTKEATVLVNQVLKDNPRDNRALMLRGKMALAKGDAVNAIADFRTVLKDQPESIEVVTELARAHLMNDEQALARDTLAQALGRYPDSTPLRIMLAEIKTATGDASGAAGDLATVLKQQPRNAQALIARAALEARTGDKAAAERTFLELKAAYPNDPTVHQRLGSFYLTQKRYKDSEAAFQAALAIVPQAIEPLTGLVNVYVSQGQSKVAVARLQQTVAAMPDNFLAWALLGHAYEAARSPVQAEEAFRTAVQKNPAIVGSHLELARYLARHGQVDGSAKALQDGLKALPDNAVLAAQLAEWHRNGRRIDDAIAVYERMLTVDADNDLAANNLANLLLDHKSDRPTLERAQKLVAHFENSLNPAYLDSLGWAQYRLGAYDKAVEVLRRASARAPESVLLSFHLGMALHRKGDLAGAKPYLQKAVESKAAIPGVEEAQKILASG